MGFMKVLTTKRPPANKDWDNEIREESKRSRHSSSASNGTMIVHSSEDGTPVVIKFKTNEDIIAEYMGTPIRYTL